MVAMVLAATLLAAAAGQPPAPPGPLSDDALLNAARRALGPTKRGAKRRIVARESGAFLSLTADGRPGAIPGHFAIVDDVLEKGDEQTLRAQHGPSLLFVGGKVLASLALPPFEELRDEESGSGLTLGLEVLPVAPQAVAAAVRRRAAEGDEGSESFSETLMVYALRGRELDGVFEATTGDGGNTFTDAEYGAWLSRGHESRAEVQVLGTRTRGLFDLAITEQGESWERCPGRGVCEAPASEASPEEEGGPPPPSVERSGPTTTRHCWSGSGYSPDACGRR